MSARFTHLKTTDYRRTPWKNGLGWTDEIAIHPPGSDLRKGDFLWRMSTARVAQSAPFSLFPEHDRVLTVLEGGGLALEHAFVEGEEPETVDLPPMEPYEFPGDVPTRCALKGGPIQDFSVFMRKGVVSVSAQAVRPDTEEAQEWEPRSRTGFVFVAQGSLEIGDFVVAAGEALRVELGDTPLEMPLLLRAVQPESSAILVQIDSY